MIEHLRDITKISGRTARPVRVIIGGSPCQDLSVAGRRAGLDGERSNLFMEQIRIIKEMRETYGKEYPRYMVWENVPGAFTSNGGEDFRKVLEETVRVADENAVVPRPPRGKWRTSGCIMGDGFSVAWRVLDAQFWGVPQRRRRIALVADFGGESAPEILFERESVSRNTAESRATRKEIAGDAAECAGITNRGACTGEITETLRAESHGALPMVGRWDVSAGFCDGNSADARSVGFEEERSPTLRAGAIPAVCAVDNHGADSRVELSKDGNVQTLTSRMGTGGNNTPYIMRQTKAYGICSQNSNSMLSDNPDSGIYEAETSRTLDTSGGNPSSNQGGIVIADCHGIGRDAFNQGCNAKFAPTFAEEIQPPLVAKGPGAVQYGYSIRRLTPLECERLQGYPDGWTDIGAWTDSKGKLHKESTDSARYKACGNSIALPPWRFVLGRLAEHLERGATMASLFDGIGGFPLIWRELGNTTVWQSEIDEFCEAVTKARFG